MRPRLLPGQRAAGDAFGVLDERFVAQQAARTGMASNAVGGICVPSPSDQNAGQSPTRPSSALVGVMIKWT